MGFFIDDLIAAAPGISAGTAATLEAAYGTCSAFVTGLDVLAHVVRDKHLLRKDPVISDPWRAIYVEIMLGVIQKKTVDEAYADAIAQPGRPTLALAEAVSSRIAAINNKRTRDLTSDDYANMLAILGYDIKMNEAGYQIEVNGERITNGILSEIRLKMRDNGYKDRDIVKDVIQYQAKKNGYHPIKDYLNSLTWDGQERIEKLAGYLYAHYAGAFPGIFRKWLIGSIAKIFDHDQNPMLVLEGGQGCGKSTFVKWLCPNKRYFRESSIKADDKDCRLAAAKVWIWEVGELGATTKREDRESLKNFLTTETFTERPAYAETDMQYPAMASFIGTVNDESGFLNDPTGNRRFWVMGIDGINWDYVKDFKVDDIWAEAMAAYTAGESHILDTDQERLMKDIAEEYQTISATEEAIKRCFLIDPADCTLWTEFSEIRDTLADPNKGKLSGSDLSDRKIANALKGLKLQADRKWITKSKPGYNPAKVLVRGYYGITPL